MLRTIFHKPINNSHKWWASRFLLVGCLRQGGYLEFLELAAYDWFVRLTPKQVEENQWITIIEVARKISRPSAIGPCRMKL